MCHNSRLHEHRPGGEIGRLRGLKKVNTLVNTTVYAGCSEATKKCPTQCRTLTPKEHDFYSTKTR